MTSGSPYRLVRRLLFVCPTLVAVASCNLLVDVPPAKPFQPPPGAPPPLTAGELLRFAHRNLGEISPGFAYRAAQPDRDLLEFLVERANLRRVVTLRGRLQPEEEAVINERGLDVIRLRMSASRPPSPRQILELIRSTQKTRADGGTLLFHCRAGADRTGAMTAIWRLLFQGVEDREALKDETFLHFHQSWSHPNVHRTIELFQPELFRPFIDDPDLMDDPLRVSELESSFYKNDPLLSGSTRVTSGPLRAGVAKRSLLSGWDGAIPMATYGPFPQNAAGVAEPVFARALVLDNGSIRLGLVSCDLLVIDPVIRARVLRALARKELDFSDLLLAATHTHTSMGGFTQNTFGEFFILNDFQPAIQDHLVECIAAALEDAVKDLRAARLGVGRGVAKELQFNRRLGTTVDPEVGLLRLTDSEGKPLAAVVNFAAHPILAPHGRISPDYPGLLAARLDERYGFGLFLQGALGDLNAQDPGHPRDWNTPGLAENVAARLFEVIDAALPRVETEETVLLGSMTYAMELPTVHASPIPDLFFPFERWAARFVAWPARVPVQSVRIGPAALVACATEAGVRLGRRIKRRSPSAFPFLVTHANGYAGYAVTAVQHAKRKLDATSLILNSSRHGARLVETAADLLEVQWGRRLDPDGPLLAPATRAPLEEQVAGRSPAEREQLFGEARRTEEAELLLDADPTAPQSRRPRGAVGDSLPDALRFEAAGRYLENLHGGDGRRGRRRDLTAHARFLLPGDYRLDAAAGYARSDWTAAVGRGRDEGATDLVLGIERPLVVSAAPLEGNALRGIPRLELSLPTAHAERAAPFAFAVGSGVWRPALGAALEYTWDTYHTLALETIYRTALDRHRGRRPGDRWEGALRYSERHGAASLLLDLNASVQLKDNRRGGRTEVDVETTSFALGLRPGFSWHFTEDLEVYVHGQLPIARSGGGTSSGRGAAMGLMLGF